MNTFLDKFNEYSEDSFSYLRLSLVNVLLKTKCLEFNFVCPEEMYDIAEQRKSEIHKYVEQAVATSLKTTIKIKKSHFDQHFFTQDIIKFFDYYASLRGSVSKRSIKYDYDEATKTHKVFISLKSIAYQMFNSRNLMRNLLEFIRSNYCENIEINILPLSETEVVVEDDIQEYSYDSATGRYIEVTNQEGLIGYTIFDLPSYICDAALSESAVLCGTIEELKEIARKPKDGVQKPSFYKFVLNDTTGTINCVFFPGDKTKGKFSCLSNNTQIVAQGKLEYNTFNDLNTLTFYIKRISYCELPKEIKINRLKLNVPKTYKNVFPKPYSEFVQSSFWGESSDKIDGNTSFADSAAVSREGANGVSKINTERETHDYVWGGAASAAEDHKELSAKKIADGCKANNLLDGKEISSKTDSAAHFSKNNFLKNREFCVFDIETTGLDRLNDKIIEIGAVKIVDGVLTQTFSSFIDPQIPVPEKIIKLTGITDKDLKDAFLLEEVLPDLLKFFDGAIIVGHNSNFFDLPFLSHAAKKHNVYFDNKTLDTYILAKEYIKIDQYRLKDLASHYKVENPNAHRALDDAITTAKIFIAMSENFRFEI